MVFSLLAYFLSMVMAFTIVMAALIGFGDSQLRIGRLPNNTAVSIVNTASDREAMAAAEKTQDAQKAEAQRDAEAKKAAEARENAKKLARAKLARERKQAMLARWRQQQRDQRENALAFGYSGQFPDTGGPSFAPRFDR
jgi:hypothetical protein